MTSLSACQSHPSPSYRNVSPQWECVTAMGMCHRNGPHGNRWSPFPVVWQLRGGSPLAHCYGCFVPQGPTLTMRIHQYSLMRDVIATLQRPRQPASMWKSPPLVVMNNFVGQVASNTSDTAISEDVLSKWKSCSEQVVDSSIRRTRLELLTSCRLACCVE